MEIHNPGVYKKLIDGTKAELMDLYNSRVEGAKIRSRINNLEESEKPTRYFLKQEHSRAKLVI